FDDFPQAASTNKATALSPSILFTICLLVFFSKGYERAASWDHRSAGAEGHADAARTMSSPDRSGSRAHGLIRFWGSDQTFCDDSCIASRSFRARACVSG